MNSLFGSAVISAACPQCQIENDVRLHDVEIGASILCRGCHATIRLVDEHAGVLQGRRSIDRAISDLKRTIRRFGGR